VATFLKAVLGGLVAVVLMWVIVLVFDMWRFHLINRQRGIGGLGAMAGGWDFLLHLPIVAALLGIAFGLGVYVTTR